MGVISPAFSETSLTLPAATALQPRHLFFFPALNWMRAFQEPGLVLVISLQAIRCIACVALARLFTNILDSIVNIWAYSTPSNQVVLEAGNLRIEFGCAMEPVPLEFVSEFAASQRDAVERGFAPLFVREWWWDRRVAGRGRLCYAGMRVVEDGGVVIPPFGH